MTNYGNVLLKMVDIHNKIGAIDKEVLNSSLLSMFKHRDYGKAVLQLQDVQRDIEDQLILLRKAGATKNEPEVVYCNALDSMRISAGFLAKLCEGLDLKSKGNDYSLYDYNIDYDAYVHAANYQHDMLAAAAEAHMGRKHER